MYSIFTYFVSQSPVAWICDRTEFPVYLKELGNGRLCQVKENRALVL